MNRLFIVRGLPGSGKTTLATILEEALQKRADFPEEKYVVSICTDEFFEDDEGNYDFNPDLLSVAHDWCKRAVYKSVKDSNIADVIVHNTFSQPWEAQPYMDMAERYGYEVFVLEAQNDFGSEHDVPQKTVDKMASRWMPLT